MTASSTVSNTLWLSFDNSIQISCFQIVLAFFSAIKSNAQRFVWRYANMENYKDMVIAHDLSVYHCCKHSTAWIGLKWNPIKWENMEWKQHSDIWYLNYVGYTQPVWFARSVRNSYLLNVVGSLADNRDSTINIGRENSEMSSEQDRRIARPCVSMSIWCTNLVGIWIRTIVWIMCINNGEFDFVEFVGFNWIECESTNEW